ncbi:MAG: ribonuclease HII [Acidobacteriia bacterium]|nr:ribonuclease HII [Terriglobia bacterium]
MNAGNSREVTCDHLNRRGLEDRENSPFVTLQAQADFFPLASQARLGEDAPISGSVSPKTKPAAEKALSPAAAKLRLLKKLRCTLNYEKKAWQAGARMVAGVDEVGRGSLFGPVVAAAVILDPAYRIRGLRDSKLLLSERREILAERIREHAIAWAVAAVDAARIDQINIYQASLVAMREAVLRLEPGPDHLLVDAVHLHCELPQKPIIHGDALSASIAAASILAKVERDRMVSQWDPVFPAYALASNKGYSTPHHLAALREHGPCPLHRQSFAPVWNAPVPQEVLAFMLENDSKATPQEAV